MVVAHHLPMWMYATHYADATVKMAACFKLWVNDQWEHMGCSTWEKTDMVSRHSISEQKDYLKAYAILHLSIFWVPQNALLLLEQTNKAVSLTLILVFVELLNHPCLPMYTSWNAFSCKICYIYSTLWKYRGQLSNKLIWIYKAFWLIPLV